MPNSMLTLFLLCLFLLGTVMAHDIGNQQLKNDTEFCSAEFDETRYESETDLSRQQYIEQCLGDIYGNT